MMAQNAEESHQAGGMSHRHLASLQTFVLLPVIALPLLASQINACLLVPADVANQLAGASRTVHSL